MSHFPQTEDKYLLVALKYDLIYAEFGYVYTLLPGLPRLGGTNTSGASHIVDDIILSLSYPHIHPSMGYGFPQGGANSSNTYPPPGTMYPGQIMPYAFAQFHLPMAGPVVAQDVYPNVAQPPYYPYPEPGAPGPLASVPLPPVPSQPLPQ